MSKKPKKVKSASVIGDRVYDTTRIRDKDGKLRFSRGNGDAVARAMLLHKSQGGDIWAIVHANKLDDRMKGKKQMQDGLLRMSVGVILRGLVRNGTPVKIGKLTIEKLTQKVEMPKVTALGDAKPKPAKPKKAKPVAKKAAAPRRKRVEKTVEFEQDFDHRDRVDSGDSGDSGDIDEAA